MCKLNSELINLLKEFSTIKKNNGIEEFCSEAENIKRQMSAQGMLSSGNAATFLADVAAKKFEKILDECFAVYKEIYEGNANKIYIFRSINKITHAWDFKQEEIKAALNTSLDENLNAIQVIGQVGISKIKDFFWKNALLESEKKHQRLASNAVANFSPCLSNCTSLKNIILSKCLKQYYRYL